MNLPSSSAAQRARSMLVGSAILLGVAATSLYSYLFFHSVAELFSIVVACSIFALAWNTRRFSENGYLLFIGIAFLFIALLDLLHTFAYKGMGVLPAPSELESNWPTQLWLAARYLQSVSFLIAPLFLTRRLPVAATFAGFLVTSAALIVSVFAGTFPDAYLPGTGLTPFKIVSEYVISVILIAAALALFAKREAVSRQILILLLAAIGLTVASELAFTLYLNVYGLPNLIGHLLKIVAFYCIYRAIVVTGLVQPYSLLFRTLKVTEERFRSLFEDAPIMYITARLENGQPVITDCNEAFLRGLGFARAEVIDQPISRFAAASLADLWRRDRTPSRREDEEYQLTTRDGETIHTLVRVRQERSASGAEELRVAFLDITQRRLAEQREQEERQFAEALATISAILNSTLDLEEVLDRILRLVEEVVPHERGSILLVEDDRLSIVRQRDTETGSVSVADREPQPLEQFPSLARIAAERRPVLMEDPTSDADTALASYLGAAGQCSCAVAPILIEGSVAGFIALTSRGPDLMTPVHADRLQAFASTAAIAIRNARLYHEARQAKERAEHADNLKVKFLAMISHELRTPLTSIKGFATTLLDSDVQFEPQEQAEFLQIIDHETDHLIDLIEQLLDLTRLEAGSFRINQEVVRIEDILARAKPELEVVTENHTLVIDKAPSALVYADRRRIGQVLTNLVGNAAKYAPAGTRIGVSSCIEGEFIRIDVTDEGPGIPKAEREAVFQVFRQAETQSVNQARGAGLGLAISKGLVEAHGGQIWIGDGMRKGTKVSFTLPVFPSEPAAG